MTLLERKSPELKALAEKLGYKIYYRGRAYWAGGDIQLTYEYYKTWKLHTLEEKIPYAIDILKEIDVARERKRSLKERVHELIELFNKQDYFPTRMFTEMYTPERDCLSVTHHYGKLSAWLDLIGEPKMSYPDNSSREVLLKSLMATEESYAKDK